MLGIIGAMDEEVAKLKEKMEQVHIIEKAGMQFYRGTLCDHEVVVVKCGVCSNVYTGNDRPVPGRWNCKYRNCRLVKCRHQHRRYRAGKGCIRA